MTLFKMWFRDRDGDIFTPSGDVSIDIPGAFSDDHIVVQSTPVRYGSKTVAKLNEKGEPYIAYEKYEYPIDPAWKRKGENHRREGDKYLRDVTESAWYINIETLEDLLKILKFHSVEIGDYGDNDGWVLDFNDW
jgi:hypothetical protein